MNTLPALFEERMRKLLPEESEAFFAALQTEPPVSIRLNPGKPVPISRLFPDEQIGLPVSWCESAYYLKSRPVFTLDPCLHSGTYYVQEASSMFLYHIFGQILPAHPVRVLDLCAAPGGKSTLIASRLSSGSLLVANEVIRSRAGILKENMIKWGTSHVVVTNNDPADFHHLKGAFDIIVVDAPCSGEGMFRKDPGAIQEWNESNLQLCSERQQRILADIWPCLKPGGFLVYSTCTYNPGENEAILERLIRKYGARSIEIAPLFPGIVPETQPLTVIISTLTGFRRRIFTGVVQKPKAKNSEPESQEKYETYPPSPATSGYIRTPEYYRPYAKDNIIGVIPEQHSEFIQLLEANLHILYQGCEIAEIINRKSKPLPSLALWQGLNKANCALLDTDRMTALTFLKKEDIPVPPKTAEWLLVTYRGQGLGWCKHLGNRLNNYYPKEWRIRMTIE
ncbi:MAG: methyltransferase RsmF C-terminal domain-like protein [Odoribacter splanchnicus]